MSPSESHTSVNVMDEIKAYGFPLDHGRLIHALVGASQLHGVKLEGTDDRDLYGVYIERPHCALWDRFEHFVNSTAPPTERNQASDVDVICYSLRKFARLAASGNPTVLHLLFAAAEDREPEWSAVLASRNLFLAKSAGRKYRGYADAQLRRMTGDRGRGKHGQRLELEQRFGYDVKAAMHVLRLLHEGIEFVSCGWVTLPRPEAERDKLLAVRRGEWSEERVIGEANRLFGDLDAAVEHSPLPNCVDKNAIGTLVTKIYLDAWQLWGWNTKP